MEFILFSILDITNIISITAFVEQNFRINSIVSINNIPAVAI